MFGISDKLTPLDYLVKMGFDVKNDSIESIIKGLLNNNVPMPASYFGQSGSETTA